MPNDLISLVANLALTFSVIVALIFGIAQVRAASRDRRERLTLEILRQFQTREFSELTLFITSHNPPSTREEYQALPSTDQIFFFQFGQEMESLGILVAERLIDIDLVDKTLGSLVTTAWARYKAVFSDIREKQPDPFLGEYFQWLAERINERMRDRPRKPFHETNATHKL